MAERTGMDESYPRRISVHRGIYGNGVPHMERKPGSDSHSHTAQSHWRTGHQFGNQLGNGNDSGLPYWYHWTTVTAVIIGFAVLIFLAAMHGG